MMEAIPLGSYRDDDELPSQLRCKTPKWKQVDRLTLQISVNGQDYMQGGYTIDIVEELKSLRISPMAGPIMGGTNITVWGTGFLSSKPVNTPLFIKFGNLEYHQLFKDDVSDA